MQKLIKPVSHRVAQQCLEMGVTVGDTIIGREATWAGRWSETKLTIKYIGASAVVFDAQRRSSQALEWDQEDETTNWTLNCRDWYLETPALTGSPDLLHVQGSSGTERDALIKCHRSVQERGASEDIRALAKATADMLAADGNSVK